MKCSEDPQKRARTRKKILESKRSFSGQTNQHGIDAVVAVTQRSSSSSSPCCFIGSPIQKFMHISRWKGIKIANAYVSMTNNQEKAGREQLIHPSIHKWFVRSCSQSLHFCIFHACMHACNYWIANINVHLINSQINMALYYFWNIWLWYHEELLCAKAMIIATY